MDNQTRIRKNRQSCPDFNTEYTARRTARKDVKSLIDQFELIADKSVKNCILKKYSSYTDNQVLDTGAMSRAERTNFSESDSVFLDANSVEKLLKTCETHNRDQSSTVAGQSAGKHVQLKTSQTNKSRNDEKPRRNDIILDMFGRKRGGEQFPRSISTQESDRAKIMQRNISSSSLKEDEQRKLNKSSQIRFGSPSYVRAKIQCFEPQEADSTDGILRKPQAKSNGAVIQSNDASCYRKRTNSYILATQSESHLKINSNDESTVENVQTRDPDHGSSSSDKHRKFKLYPPPSPKPDHLKLKKTPRVQDKQEVKSTRNVFEQIKTLSDPVDSRKRSTYVSQAVSKFEKDPHNPILAVVDLQDPKGTDYLKDQINNIFLKRRATGSSNKEIRKQLSSQINDILLERHKHSQKEPDDGIKTLENVCNEESDKEDTNEQNILTNSRITEENKISVECEGDENNVLTAIDNQNEANLFENKIGAESLEDKHKENVINIDQWERQITPSENCEETISKEITATSNKDSIEQCSDDKAEDKSETKNCFDEEKIITLVYHHIENENSDNMTVSSNNQGNSSENCTLETVTLIQIAATDEDETNAKITSDNIGEEIKVENQEIDLKSSAECTVETPNTKPDYVIIMRDSATINSHDSSSSKAENETQNKPESPQIHNVSEAINTNVKSVHLSTNDSEWSLDKLSTKSMKMQIWSINSNEDMTRNDLSDEESKCYSVRTTEIDDSESFSTPDKSFECSGEFTVPVFESQGSVDEINTSVEELLAHVDNVRQSIPVNTQRVSRLYSAKFGTGSPVSSDVQKQDSDSNNNTKTTTKNESERKEDDRILLENIERLSDKNDDDDELSTANEAMNFVLEFCEEVKKDQQFVEVYNPRISKELYINEWVQNVNQDYSVSGTESQAEESNDDESILSGISATSEDQVFQSFEYSLSAQGQQSWTYRDDQDNPMFVNQSTFTPYNSEAVELRSSSRTIDQRIEESESEYRRSIENIKNNSRRKGLMEEIISTERRYVEGSLRLLVQEYMPEMDRSDLPVGLVGRGGQIFGNVQLLYEAHLQFLPALEACKNTDQIADCFLKHDNLFKLYPLYTKNKPVSDSVMKDYGSFFTRKQKELRDPLDLASYLLTPVQRLGKYCLLMKSLTRECEKENMCNEKVKKATEMLQKQMSLGNDLIATDSIVGCEVSLREQGELLLRDTFTVSSPTKRLPFEAMVFLFQESLIITCIHRQNASEEFLFREVFKLTDMGYTYNNNENLTFQVWFRKRNQKTYSLKAKKPSVKDKWTKEIHTLLWQQLEANKRRKKKEQEELGLKPAPVPVSPRPISIPTTKRHKLSPKFGRIRSSPVWYTPET